VRQVVAELLRELGTPYGELWRELVDEHGVKQAARSFARALRAMDEQGEATVSERVQVALCSGEAERATVIATKGRSYRRRTHKLSNKESEEVLT
jgi:hypothetical protein